MGHLVPNIQAMWEAYCQERHADDHQALALRSVAFLGWHLIDRTIARASSVAKLPGIERARLAPDNLARFLTQYSVMGWGVDALLDIHRIDSLSLEDLAPAFAGLVYPIGAVLGIDLG